jgi:hypothetical protein
VIAALSGVGTASMVDGPVQGVATIRGCQLIATG